MYVPDLCGVYYLEIKYRNEDKRERLYGNFTEGTEDKNTQNIENTEKGSSFYPEELPFLRVYLFNRKSMQSVICGRCGIKENFYVESNRLYKQKNEIERADLSVRTVRATWKMRRKESM